MKVELDIDKIINDHSQRRMEIMKYLCEEVFNKNTMVKLVDELRYLTGVINTFERIKNTRKS